MIFPLGSLRSLRYRLPELCFHCHRAGQNGRRRKRVRCCPGSIEPVGPNGRLRRDRGSRFWHRSVGCRYRFYLPRCFNDCSLIRHCPAARIQATAGQGGGCAHKNRPCGPAQRPAGEIQRTALAGVTCSCRFSLGMHFPCPHLYDLCVAPGRGVQSHIPGVDGTRQAGAATTTPPLMNTRSMYRRNCASVARGAVPQLPVQNRPKLIQALTRAVGNFATGAPE